MADVELAPMRAPVQQGIPLREGPPPRASSRCATAVFSQLAKESTNTSKTLAACFIGGRAARDAFAPPGKNAGRGDADATDDSTDHPAPVFIRPGSYPYLFTIVVVTSCIAIFVFMAGQWPLYRLHFDCGGIYRMDRALSCRGTHELAGLRRLGGVYPADEQSSPIVDDLIRIGPWALDKWLRQKHAAAFSPFDVQYLILWGSRFDPIIVHEPGQYYRWFTSVFIHYTFAHLAGNLVALAFASAYLERRFGWFRIAPLFVLAGAGGGILSEYIDRGTQCVVTCGASGAVFGLASAALTDIVLNWAASPAPVLTTLAILPSLALIGAPTTGTPVSVSSHGAGVVFGVLFALALFPTLGSPRLQGVTIMRWVLQMSAIAAICLLFVLLALRDMGQAPYSGLQPASNTCYFDSTASSVTFPRNETSRTWPIGSL